MVTKNFAKLERRTRRKRRLRKNIQGTEQRYRLSIYRSLNNIYAQIIDDVKKETLVSASSIEKDIAGEIKTTSGKTEKSKIVGELLAKRALQKNIAAVVFDRNGYLYHGRVKALAEAAREAGLNF